MVRKVVASPTTARVAIATAMSWLAGCDKQREQPTPAPSASAYAPSELPAELKKQVLAKVGDRTITLGEFAATLERMDPFERLRYSSRERREQLLKEMMDVELLAQEARRRGLHKLPETQERLREILRDELLRQVRADVPEPSEIPVGEVRRYYEEHRSEFSEPERRRASLIVLSGRAEAAKLLTAARNATPERWGELYQAHSIDAERSKGSPEPLDLAGDVGIVSAPGAEPNENPRLTLPLRTALFEIRGVGDVYPNVVEDKGKFYILRMTGRTPARQRTFAEAERAIRVRLVQRRVQQREAAFEKELRKRYPVEIDEKALSSIPVGGKKRAK